MRSPETRKPSGGSAVANQTSTHVPIVPPSRYACKIFARLQAEAALAGIRLVRTSDETYLVIRWNLTREFPTLDLAAQFLAQMGVQ